MWSRLSFKFCVFAKNSSKFLAPKVWIGAGWLRTMSVFISTVNPVTGKPEWIMQDEDYDFYQEIARSAYADMLHDTERNQMYYEALKDAIHIMHHRGLPAHVLDIGTGTGLLSMMAARCGADSVTACEQFDPMAACAHTVIQDNGFKDRIKIIKKRSTDVTVGPDGDMAQRANILVTEVFDTELIGEGAISTFHHAHLHLLQKDCIVVPNSARMYAQVISSEEVRRWNQFQPIQVGDQEEIRTPFDMLMCPGATSLHDLQLDQLPVDKFQPITDPVQIFEFDYSGKSSIDFSGMNVTQLQAKTSGTCDAVFMWWDLQMDTRGRVLLSCAPRWAHPTPHKMAWRDHWMQAIYYPHNKTYVEAGQDLLLHSNHDEYSLWFDVTRPENENEAAKQSAACTCGAHVTCSRPRLGLLGDPERNQKFVNAISKVITKDTVCLCMSDGSLLPLIAAHLGAKHVYTLEPEKMSRKMVQTFVDHNGLNSQITVLDKPPDQVLPFDLNNQKVDLLLSEPYFSSSMLPWQHLHFWYGRTDLENQGILAPGRHILPCCATMRAIAVDFKDLWKIRAPVGNCEGFDLKTFDKLIEKSCDIADAYVEPQPLWEYPGVPLTESVGLMNFDFSKPLSGLRTVNRQGYTNFNVSGTCNGIAVWMEYYLDNKNSITTGLVAPPKAGENLRWEMNSRQGVHLLKLPVKVNPDNPETEKLKFRYKVTFKPQDGDFTFDFSVR